MTTNCVELQDQYEAILFRMLKAWESGRGVRLSHQELMLLSLGWGEAWSEAKESQKVRREKECLRRNK